MNLATAVPAESEQGPPKIFVKGEHFFSQVFIKSNDTIMGKGRKRLDLNYQCWKADSLYLKQENWNRAVILSTSLGAGEERRQVVKKLSSRCWFEQEGIQG